MREKGSTLIEALIALSVAVAIISAIVIAVISSLSNAQFTKNQNQANHYAQEGMETVRQIRNNDWLSFVSFASTRYCLAENSKVLTTRGASGCGQNIGIYVREIDIEHNSPSCVGTSRVTSNVLWSDAKCTDATNSFCHKVTLISCMGNNSAVPTP